ncbi:MAG: helix-turn-helix domain-containing protein [Terrisporobacter sp.]
MDKIKIGESIYNLRKLKKITQEQLGDYVGVSKGAISKWESGVSYPDIEMLPVLARFFSVSIDELLNFDAIISEEMMEAICKECQDIINAGDGEKGIELCQSYINKYPTNYKLKFTLVTLMTMGCALMKDEVEIKNIYGKAIGVYEDIVNNSTDEETVVASKLQLINYYASFEEFDKSIEILEKMKKPLGNTNIMKASIYIRKNDLEEGRKLYQYEFFNCITEAQAILHGLASSYYKENLELAERYMELGLQIRELTLHNKYNNTFGDYLQLAGLYAYYKNEEKTIEAISKAVKALEGIKDVDENPWYFSEMKLSGDFTAILKMSSMVINLLEMKEYEFLKDNKEFLEIKERIQKIEY